MQNEWEAEALKRGFPGEKEMWETLYKNNSLAQLTEMFGKSANTIRTRINKNEITIRHRGGPNNTKTSVDRELIDDVVNLGVRKAALKRGIKPQTLYQRLYYKCGLTVKGLKEAALKDGLPPEEVAEVVKE